MARSSKKSSCTEYICFWSRRKKSIESSYDPRFGAAEITAPNQGAYSNPHYRAPNTVAVARVTKAPDHLRKGAAYKLGDTKSQQTSPTFSEGTTAAHSSRTALTSPYTPTSTVSTTSVPVHEAFIPGDKHIMRSVSISSPSNSPPSSPPLPTPTSIQTRKPNLALQFKKGSSPKLQDAMSYHQYPDGPPMPVPEPEMPSPTESIEQWPGSM